MSPRPNTPTAPIAAHLEDSFDDDDGLGVEGNQIDLGEEEIKPAEGKETGNFYMAIERKKNSFPAPFGTFHERAANAFSLRNLVRGAFRSPGGG